MGWALSVDGVGDGMVQAWFWARLVPRWSGWLSVVFFGEQAIETVTVFGQSGFIAPGGAMNLYLGGGIGMAWVIGVMVWGRTQLRATPSPHGGVDPSWS